MSIFSKRLKEVREDRNLKQKDLADELGITSARLSTWELGKRAPDIIMLSRISKILDVDPNYLLGTSVSTVDRKTRQLINFYMQSDDVGKQLILYVAKHESERTQSEKYQPICKITYNDIPASAGTGQPLDYSNADTITVLEDPPRDASFVLRVTGDSMNPTYYNNDRIYVSKKTDLRYGDTGIFFYDGNVYIKEYTADGLKSHNPEYPLIKADENIKCLGKVVGKVKNWE